MDEFLRKLQTTKHDEFKRWRFRNALLRTGLEVKLETGDLVTLNHQEVKHRRDRLRIDIPFDTQWVVIHPTETWPTDAQIFREKRVGVTIELDNCLYPYVAEKMENYTCGLLWPLETEVTIKKLAQPETKIAAPIRPCGLSQCYFCAKHFPELFSRISKVI